jgi:ElaB/YqjD/DUF883 family membrane-anchored ribosome-binding protein
MSDFEAETGPEAKRVAEDVASLKRDMAALIKQMKESALREANRIGHDTADRISDRASGIYETVSDKSRKSADAVTAHVEEQPLSSLLIAFAAGFIFSKILTR